MELAYHTDLKMKNQAIKNVDKSEMLHLCMLKKQLNLVLQIATQTLKLKQTIESTEIMTLQLQLRKWHYQ